MILTDSRLDEIRSLLAELASPPAELDEQRGLLTRCRRALADVLGDRDDLATSHASLAEELAVWNGQI
ncbi:hypothetical protein ACFWH1_18710 [Streptomyces sp. NPDC127037]|uniref:hypothetical protein n=1 Tax=Streptomyces sp. NPDC127037 TaxID=3347113 RepID=UPI0036616493